MPLLFGIHRLEPSAGKGPDFSIRSKPEIKAILVRKVLVRAKADRIGDLLRPQHFARSDIHFVQDAVTIKETVGFLLALDVLDNLSGLRLALTIGGIVREAQQLVTAHAGDVSRGIRSRHRHEIADDLASLRIKHKQLCFFRRGRAGRFVAHGLGRDRNVTPDSRDIRDLIVPERVGDAARRLLWIGLPRIPPAQTTANAVAVPSAAEVCLAVRATRRAPHLVTARTVMCQVRDAPRVAVFVIRSERVHAGLRADLDGPWLLGIEDI